MRPINGICMEMYLSFFFKWRRKILAEIYKKEQQGLAFLEICLCELQIRCSSLAKSLGRVLHKLNRSEGIYIIVKVLPPRGPMYGLIQTWEKEAPFSMKRFYPYHTPCYNFNIHIHRAAITLWPPTIPPQGMRHLKVCNGIWYQAISSRS